MKGLTLILQFSDMKFGAVQLTAPNFHVSYTQTPETGLRVGGAADKEVHIVMSKAEKAKAQAKQAGGLPRIELSV
jgi:hypothetical protein